ncbi:efflux RND transporter periplasmic adaptor subunit [Lutibaculum baratangense]|uniref:Uncharacterized protein n=1 Tax=Lutibaculum baratangense AMV1 TaxID=631454 RepID=V4RDF0_9HYPH|nr:HlyD family efflux transporter periplasmic adaptor subunit [Lutibaculum baratangense]ESR23379.1 hypothetical protein N177_3447 [Lutibaculum baratangense AMV1]
MAWLKRLLLLLLVLGLGGAVYWGLRPDPVPVDAAVLARGQMQVSVGEEGKTRIRDVYRVSAPIAGRAARTSLKVGDEVVGDETLITTIHPADPPFIDVRTERELRAAVSAASAGVGYAEAELSRANAQLRLVEGDLERAQRLSRSGTISARALEKAVLDVETAKAGVREAEASLELRRSELRSAEARLIQPGSRETYANGDTCCVEVRAPVSGVVLSLPVDSEQVIQAGKLLAEIGSTSDLEIVVDLLSNQALSIEQGARATITEWGGQPLEARVRRIDPAAFTKVSALGIEEQRVNAVLDIEAPRETYARLGHGFRVYVEIVVWTGDDILLVPLGALFRAGPDWAVFVVEEGQARLRRVEIGRRNTQVAQVLSGLEAGDLVILHPSDRVEDGIEVAPRQE